MYLKLHYDQKVCDVTRQFHLWLVSGTEVESPAKIGNEILSHNDLNLTRTMWTRPMVPYAIGCNRNEHRVELRDGRPVTSVARVGK
jgi:hypothetical protein